MARKPFQDSRLEKLLDKSLLELKHKSSQVEIATKAGFVNPNMLTMLKQGSNKLAPELMRWMPPPDGIECAKVVLSRIPQVSR